MKRRITYALLTICYVLCSELFLAQAATIPASATYQDAPATPKFEVSRVEMVDLPKPNRGIIKVVFDVPLSDEAVKKAETSATANLTIVYFPSGKIVQASLIKVINFSPGRDNQLDIRLEDNEEASPASDDNAVHLKFAVVHFKDMTKKDLPGKGKIFNAKNISELKQQALNNLKEAVAHAKTTEEKDIFLGLNVVVPSGGGGQAAGNADLSFNRVLRASTLGQAALFDEIQFGLHLKKASEERADPRHFDFGLNFRKTFLRANRQKLTQIKSVIDGIKSENENTTALNNIKDLQKDFVRAFLFDNALRFEGDVGMRGISNVSNVLYDTQLQVATVSQAFAGQTGFVNFRFVAAGFEVGGNLTNNDMADATMPTMMDKKPTSLARFKTGAELNLIFKASNANEPIGRVELSAKGLQRYLFKNETAFDEMTKKAILVDKGSKYWLQADFKVTSGIRVGAGRVGFRASFNRGFLPPVYRFVNAFTYGLVFETTDDDNSGNMK